MKLTYEQAREIEIWTWEHIVEHERRPSAGRYMRVWGYVPLCGGIFCDYFDTRCGLCPMYWPHPKEEPHSAWKNGHAPCSRNYWHWKYWAILAGKKAHRWAKHWAGKMLEEVRATPEHLEEER